MTKSSTQSPSQCPAPRQLSDMDLATMWPYVESPFGLDTLRDCPSASSSTTNSLISVLSASSYPVPPPPRSLVPSRPGGQPQTMFLGGLQLDAQEDGQQGDERKSTDDTIQNVDMLETPESAVKRAATANSRRKVGRPRKTTEGMAEQGPQERRRAQVRLAQRAYRSRKEANVSSLRDRAVQLESALQKMRAAVITLGDDLLQSGVLDVNKELAGSLGKTVQTSLLLAREADSETDAGSSPSNKSTSPPEIETIPGSPKFYFTPSPPSHHDLVIDQFLGPLPDATMDCSTFIRRLRLTCISQACLVLRDMSIPTEKLRRTFRLMFTVASRQRVALFFESALTAILNKTPMEDWGEIPFFRLGGAGSHYPLHSSRSSGMEVTAHRYEWRATVQDPLSCLSADAREGLEGDWFDIHDLEGFLREQKVQLRDSPPGDEEHEPFDDVPVNAQRLKKELTRRAICLGRTPGFRRRDVERAVHSAVWA